MTFIINTYAYIYLYEQQDGVDALQAMCQIFENHHLLVVLDGVSRIRRALNGHEFFEKLVEKCQVVEKWTQTNLEE